MNSHMKNRFKRYLKFFIFSTSQRKQKWFHDFNFDIMKPLPVSAPSKLQLVLNILQSEIRHFRISDGTLLGLFRDKRLIPHDNDIDFDVEYDLHNERKIKNLARHQNWILGRHVKYHGKTQQLTYYDEECVIFDFIFWHTDDLFAINFSEPNKFRIMPKRYIRDLGQTYFDEIGTEVNIPNDSESWAAYRYGPSWYVPENRKGDWTETCGDLGNAWWIES